METSIQAGSPTAASRYSSWQRTSVPSSTVRSARSCSTASALAALGGARAALQVVLAGQHAIEARAVRRFHGAPPGIVDLDHDAGAVDDRYLVVQ